MKVMLPIAAAFAMFANVGFAADLEVPLKAVPVAPPYTWTSCYAGLQAGGGLGQTNLTDSFGTIAATGAGGFNSANAGIDGYLLGGQIGCDYQFASNWVAGFEGSAGWGNISGSTNVAIPGDSVNFTENTDLLTSLTARLGYAWNDWLLYAKGGAAWTGNRYSASDAAGLFAFSGLETRIGWTAGAGVEWALSRTWSVKLEYDYYGFGTRSVTFIDNTISGITGPVNINQNVQIVKLGLNFHVYGAASGPWEW